eukprot:g6779.t1
MSSQQTQQNAQPSGTCFPDLQPTAPALTPVNGAAAPVTGVPIDRRCSWGDCSTDVGGGDEPLEVDPLILKESQEKDRHDAEKRALLPDEQQVEVVVEKKGDEVEGGSESIMLLGGADAEDLATVYPLMRKIGGGGKGRKGRSGAVIWACGPELEKAVSKSRRMSLLVLGVAAFLVLAVLGWEMYWLVERNRSFSSSWCDYCFIFMLFCAWYLLDAVFVERSDAVMATDTIWGCDGRFLYVFSGVGRAFRVNGAEVLSRGTKMTVHDLGSLQFHGSPPIQTGLCSRNKGVRHQVHFHFSGIRLADGEVPKAEELSTEIVITWCAEDDMEMLKKELASLISGRAVGEEMKAGSESKPVASTGTALTNEV